MVTGPGTIWTRPGRVPRVVAGTHDAHAAPRDDLILGTGTRAFAGRDRTALRLIEAGSVDGSALVLPRNSARASA
jgi:hypothetical protein